MTIDDPKIIEARLSSILSNVPEQVAFSHVAGLIEDALIHRDSQACRDLIICTRAMASLVHQPAFINRMRDLYDCTIDDEALQAITRAYFTDYPPSKSGNPTTDVQSALTLISQPLGVQKSMARTALRNHHEALFYSPWPQVIEILCANPHIQERDIIFMASRRPSMNELLEPILASQWSSRAEIRFALAANPAISVSHAMRCMLTLQPQKIQILSEMPELHPFLRSFASRVLEFIA